MRVQNSPAAYGWLAGLLTLLLGLLAANSGCCQSGVRVTTPSQPAPLDRAAATVRILTECGAGTGVLIDETHVITAHHVIDCEPSDEKVQLAERVDIVTAGGVMIQAAFDSLDNARDLARLKLSSPVAGAAHITFARPLLGEVECATTATPERKQICGVFEQHLDIDRQRGDIILEHMSVWFGNSGSPLWDAEDHLVGVVVRLMWCSDFDENMYHTFGIRTESCGGRASTLEGAVLP